MICTLPTCLDLLLLDYKSTFTPQKVRLTFFLAIKNNTFMTQ